jgi:hypothetical protein
VVSARLRGLGLEATGAATLDFGQSSTSV